MKKNIFIIFIAITLNTSLLNLIYAETFYPPFSSAQQGHQTDESKMSFSLYAAGISLYDPEGHIDATNGIINQSAFAGASIFGAARVNVDDYIDIPIPIKVTKNDWYQITVTGAYGV